MDDAAPSRRSVEHVHRAIREAILDGEFAGGEVISQVALAEQFGVSRTPLREALRMLQNEGLIEGEPNRRVRVAELSLADLEELYTIRIPLEVTGLRLSLPRMRPEDVGRLEGAMAEMAHFAELGEYRGWHVPHMAFHRGLTVYAGPRFNALLVQLFEHAERYRRMHFGRLLSEQSTTDHRAILDAVKAADRDLAAALLARHLARTVFGIIELVDPAYAPDALRAVLDDVSATTGHEAGVEVSRPKRGTGRRGSGARRRAA
ncbi:MAG TPA: GntR family transcriptional regulator [Solirubrobacteraceae bacterium]|nr:GntR family transcriptional regulator [Solirubrobacteraceae bacterium]